jgi:hypothetical protein
MDLVDFKEEVYKKIKKVQVWKYSIIIKDIK